MECIQNFGEENCWKQALLRPKNESENSTPAKSLRLSSVLQARTVMLPNRWWPAIFQVLTVASVKMTAYWDITMRNLKEVDWCFRGAYCLHHQGDLMRLHGAIFQKAVIFRLWPIPPNFLPMLHYCSFSVINYFLQIDLTKFYYIKKVLSPKKLK
jgi:hypothetical protein